MATPERDLLREEYLRTRASGHLAGADRLLRLEELAWACPGLPGFLLASVFHLLREQQDERPVAVEHGRALLRLLDAPIMDGDGAAKLLPAAERLATAGRAALRLDSE
jgi:hypothetical protein